MPPKKPKDLPPAAPSRRMKGFEPAASLLAARIRAAGESRGFAVARVLTHWAEIVGEDVARMARPVRLGYGGRGLGATLTLLVGPAHGPVVQMQIPRIIERVNACYGHAAVSRIALTQTAPAGFAEPRPAFAPAPRPAPVPDPALAARAEALPDGVRDEGLRLALAALAARVFERGQRS